MTAETLALTLVQTLVVLAIGRALVSLARPRLVTGTRMLGAPESWLLSGLAFVAAASLLMMIHMASSGWLFAQPWPVPVVGAAVIGAAAWKSRARHGHRRGNYSRMTASRTFVLEQLARVSPWVVVLAIVLVGLYALPGIRGGSSLRTGDPPWHLGWTQQLLGGEARPEGPAPEPFARNAYPWGHHAVLATMTRLVPGTDPVIAHESLQLLLIVWLPLAAACLARTINRRAGLAAAAAMSLIGGFGWIDARAPDFVETPTRARYGADLVVASPNSVYELLPPALPRELGLVLLACCAILVLAALTRPSLGGAAIAGASVGIVGLVSVPMLISAIAWTTVAAFVVPGRRSARRLLLMGAAAAAIFAVWVAPVVVDHLRYGGFVEVSPRLGVEWRVVGALGAWGLLLPLAIAGLAIAITQPPVLHRGLVAFTCAAAAMLIVAWLRRRAGWPVFANETALVQGRFWPPAHLVASALAGLALTAGYGWVARRSKALAAIGVASVVFVGAISPLFASIALTGTIRKGERGFLYGNEDLQRGSFVRSAASIMGPDEVVAVEGDDLLAFYLWQFSGARIANPAATTPPVGNAWRIRYRSLAEAWREAAHDRGIPADWLVTGDPGIGVPIESGTFWGRTWALVRPRD